MARDNSDDIWEFNGNKYKVGNCLTEDWNKDSIYPIVWFKKKLYVGNIKPESKHRIDRIRLIDIYNTGRKPYWTTIDKVYQVIKIK